MTPTPTMIDQVTATMRAIIYDRSSHAKEKSIEGQGEANRGECQRLGWAVVDELEDSTSASRHASKPRENWPALLAQIPNVDVVVMWTPSRGDRTAGSWIAFIDDCRHFGVKIHATSHGITYDPRIARHYKSLAEDGIDAAFSSDQSSEVLRMALVEHAKAGSPHSRTPYGYTRLYDAKRKLVEQAEHPEHANVVREIIRRIGKGDAIGAIARDLTRRGVGTPAAWHPPLLWPKWSAQTVVGTAKNRAYAPALDEDGQPVTKVLVAGREPVIVGVRVHHPTVGEVREYPAAWPALVTADEWYAAARILADPARLSPKRPRSGGATSLLGNLAHCGTCHGLMGVRRVSDGSYAYRCCPSIGADELDALVTALVVGRLSDPAVYGQLRHASEGDDRAALEAHAEVDRLNTELDEWRQSCIRGETTRATMNALETGLTARIAEARRRAETASTPPVLRSLIGPDEDEDALDVRARWDLAPLGARRDAVRQLLKVTVYPTKGRGTDVADRIEIAWL